MPSCSSTHVRDAVLIGHSTGGEEVAGYIGRRGSRRKGGAGEPARLGRPQAKLATAAIHKAPAVGLPIVLDCKVVRMDHSGAVLPRGNQNPIASTSSSLDVG